MSQCKHCGYLIVVLSHLKDVIQLTHSKLSPTLCSITHLNVLFNSHLHIHDDGSLIPRCNTVISSFQVLDSHPLPSDFPGEVSGRCAAERASPLLWKNRTKRRRASHPAEGYNEQGASEADIDSDSGYCSPKHNQAAGVTQRTAENTAAPTVSRRSVELVLTHNSSVQQFPEVERSCVKYFLKLS